MERLISELYQPRVRSLPASFGPLKGANANGRVTGPCGDTMEFWLMIRDGRILRATFTTDGCGASIACGGEALAREMGVPFLGKVPLDPQVVDSGDAGTPFVQRFASSPTAHAFEDIVRTILLSLHRSKPQLSQTHKP